jgi:hypothetical protein
LKLIKSINDIIKPGGKIIFAAGPITNAFSMLWGFRLGGECLSAIRNNGWCELGFTKTYFQTVMNDNAWEIPSHNCLDTPWGSIFVATKVDD